MKKVHVSKSTGLATSQLNLLLFLGSLLALVLCVNLIPETTPATPQFPGQSQPSR